MLLGNGRNELQLWLREPVAGAQTFAAIIPLDEFAQRRTEGALRLLRYMKGHKAPEPRETNPRLKNMLRALDGHLEGCSYRVIAEVLFGRERVASEPWKTSPLRDATIRLVRGGVAMMRGGYRKLLEK